MVRALVHSLSVAPVIHKWCIPPSLKEERKLKLSLPKTAKEKD